MNIIEKSLNEARQVMEGYLADPDTVANLSKASEIMAESIRNGGNHWELKGLIGNLFHN